MGHVEISVIVAVYNTELYISQCIRSILNQTFRDFELIVVDDGSTDGTIKIIEDIIREGDPRIQLIKNSHLGAGAARNTGQSIAKGKYLMFLDADDFFEPQLLEKLYECSEKNNTDISVCMAQGYNDTTGETDFLWYAFRKGMIPDGVFSAEDVYDRIFNIFMGWAWDKLFRTEFIRDNQIEFQNFRSSNDLYFVFMALVHARRIAVVESILVNYRQTNQGSLHHTSNLSWDCFFKAALHLKNALIGEGLYEKTKKSYLNWCADFFHSQMRERDYSEASQKAYELVQNGLPDIGFFEMEEDKYIYKEAYAFIDYMKDHTYIEYVNERFRRLLQERNRLRDENGRLKSWRGFAEHKGLKISIGLPKQRKGGKA